MFQLHDKTSRTAQLVDQLRSDILAGILAPGTRLKSMRDMAAELGVSKQVVESAYGELLKDGLVEKRPGPAGTCVRAAPAGDPGGSRSATLLLDALMFQHFTQDQRAYFSQTLIALLQFRLSAQGYSVKLVPVPADERIGHGSAGRELARGVGVSGGSHRAADGAGSGSAGHGEPRGDDAVEATVDRALAQVAAWADTQLVVVKDVDHVASAALSSGQDRGVSAASGRSTARTRTRVERVEGRERERELARMLSGHAESEAALRHAAELLAESGVAQSQT